jgi:hypothetical protein
MENHFAKLLFLMLCALILSACSSSVPTEFCGDCGAEYPEKYGVRDFYGYTVCPSCAEQQIREYVNEQESAYNSIENYGEYIADDEDYMVVEKSECSWCGNYAPSDLYDENGERICIDCITEALQDSKVARAIRNYIEYG